MEGYTWAYDLTEAPAVAQLEVGLSHAWAGGDEIAQSLLVDSGAFMTGVPISVLRHLQARRVGQEQVYDFDGRIVRVPVYEVSIDLAGSTFRPFRVIGLESQTGFIGRDLLNEFLVSLDGPSRVMTVKTFDVATAEHS